jgi:hypothetical protein
MAKGNGSFRIGTGAGFSLNIRRNSLRECTFILA